ncbi:MAG: hypothetical protein DBY43_06615 [Clostridiaceae bacterium]|nr:MAG: hypothetical protein DBY43_06615 [Clostridiaceae bacterium]
MANKLLSVFNVGGVDYNLKDAAATAKLNTLLGEQTVKELGAAAWKAVAATISGEGLVDASVVKAYVDSQVGQIHNFDVVIDAAGTTTGPSVAASADTMYKIYLVPSDDAAAGGYIEYITIRSGAEGAYTYAWEAIGNTKVSLTGYVPTTTTIATIALDHNITVTELQTALGLKAFARADKGTATVASQTVSGVKATGTSTGSLTGTMAYDETDITSTGTVTATGSVTGSAISDGTIAVTLKDAATATAANVTATAYKPAGTVETTFTAAAEDAVGAVSFGGVVSKPTAKVTPATATIKGMKDAGTAYSITKGSVEKAADTKSAFATEGVTASVNEDTETLTFAAAGTSQAVTAAGDVTYTAPALSGALPTFEDATVMTGATVDVSQPIFTGDKYAVNSTFAGTEEANMKVTGVTYVKQAIDKATFTGTAATLGFSGDAVDVSVAGKYDKANKGTLAFTGANIELAVGDIAVPSQTIEVTPVTE